LLNGESGELTCKHVGKKHHFEHLLNTLHNRLLFRSINRLPRKTRRFASLPSQLFESK